MISSEKQTKEWRKNQEWYKNGKKNECEKYQLSLLEKIISSNIEKTNDRLNIKNKEIKSVYNPLKEQDGFEWTENFDGKYIVKEDKENIYYFNLKFVCGRGGSQTRTLREVYHFIKTQLDYIKQGNNNVFFINILEGDESYRHRDKFQYLIKNTNNIFVGDVIEFNSYWSSIQNKLINKD